MSAVKTVGLTKKYGRFTAVSELSLDIREGELYALLGVNGAGKTTTVRMLSCLAVPTSGDAFLCGKSIVSEADGVKRIIGTSPQESAVAENLTVLENLSLMCGAYGLDKAAGAKKISELIMKFSLSEVCDRRASKLSGGYKRRLSIAMALVGEPKILFLDEPTLGLDVISRAELWDTVRELKSKTTTVILTTHYMEEAEALSDRIGIMKSGNLIAEGTAEELKLLASAEKFEDAFIKLVRGVEK